MTSAFFYGEIPATDAISLIKYSGNIVLLPIRNYHRLLDPNPHPPLVCLLGDW